MLKTIVIILAILWLLGFFVVHISSGLVHLLLLIAAVVLIYDLLTAGRHHEV